MINGEYIDLRTLEDGTRFHVINGEWTGYVFSQDNEKHIHIDATNKDKKLNGNEDLIIKIIK